MPPRYRSLMLAALFSLGTAQANAACFELIGCTDSQRYRLQDLRQLSCESLWLVRNTMYDENGYCFQTARAQSMFSNAGCMFTDANRVRLSNVERANVEQVLKIEAEKGCP